MDTTRKHRSDVPCLAPIAQRLSRVGLFVARHRRGFVFRKLAGLCRRYLSWYGNVSYELQSNGESFVLETVAGFHPRVLFDVGANTGEWTLTARRHCPDAQIHAFEVAPPTFETLVANTCGDSGIYCRNVGLSDAAGSLRLKHYSEVPALTTASEYPHPFASTELMGEVVTGDEYAAQHAIAHIDLLKIDVEGMEQQVLNGFRNMLARQAIDLIQFEYGRVSIVNRFFLKDFHDFFRERGYVVGKVYPNYVDFRDYDFADEDFLGPNYLACREGNLVYREALCGAARRQTSRPGVKSAQRGTGDKLAARTP